MRVTVADFEPMKAKALELLAWLGKAKLKVPAEELKEVRSYLEWLLDNHFTFLGYEEFTVADEADGGRMVYDEKSFLGLTRLLRAGLSRMTCTSRDYAVAYLREPVLLSFARLPIRAACTAQPTRTTCRSASWTAGPGDPRVPLHGPVHLLGVQRASTTSPSSAARSPSDAALRFRHQGPPRQGLAQVLEVLPRDDLFQTPVDELFSTALAIVRIQERNKIRVFLRKDPTVASATAWPTCRATCIPPRRA